MSKTVKKVIGVAAPLAGLIPGIGLPAAVALGAGGGLLSGNGLKGAITGGLGAGLLGGGSGLLGNAISGGLDLGLSTSQAAGLGGTLLGAGAGGASGGLKGALLGGAAGGLGSYANAGGLSGIGDSLGITGEGSLLGTSAGTPLAGGIGPTQGSGVLGSATRGLSDIGSALSTGIGGGSSTYSGGNSGSSYAGIGALLGGINSLNANDQAQEDLLTAQNNSISQLEPYLASGQASNSRLQQLLGVGGDATSSDYGSLTKPFTPDDLTNDPGYQFQLQEGQKAIDRSLGAKGKMFSGEALKAASQFGTGLADQTYKDAYARDAAQKAQDYSMFAGQSGQGLNAAGGATQVYDNIGNAKANAGISSSNILNSTLSSLLSGSGAKRRIQLYDGSYAYV